jgi:UPF0271 protein
MMAKLDINCDMGESFGVWKLGADDEIIKYITSANIACGLHGGDPTVMRKTVKLAMDHNVNVGVHPGYPDLQGFGRRFMNLSYDEMRDYMIYQIGALMGFAQALGTKVKHFKTHGVISNVAARDPKLSRVLAEAMAEVDKDMIYIGLAGTPLVTEAEALGLRVAHEAYADRAYLADGNLVPRGTPGAVIHDEKVVAQRVLRMVTEGKVAAIDGTVIPVKAHTICVHGDTPGAADFARTIRTSLEALGIEIVPLDKIV